MITVLSCRGQITVLHSDEITKQIKEDWQVKARLKNGGSVQGTFYKCEDEVLYLRQEERIYPLDLSRVDVIEYKIGGNFERDASIIMLLIMGLTVLSENGH